MTDSSKDVTRIGALARSFPNLDLAPGVGPWDPAELDRWAGTLSPSHPQFFAAQFVLAVWDLNGEWDVGPFEVVEAVGVWGEGHRAAFLAWAQDPWYRVTPKPSSLTGDEQQVGLR